MIKYPGVIAAGSTKIPESWFRDLDNCLHALTGRSSTGVRVNVGPGGTTYTVLYPGRAIPSLNYPFKLLGYVDADGQGYISVAYGEINEVAPLMGDGGDPMGENDTYVMKADDDGVVYAAVTIDPDSRAVVSFYFSMESDEESIPDDTDTAIYIVIGRFYIDNSQEGETGSKTPIPTNYIRDHIVMEELNVMDQGKPVRNYYRSFLRDSVAVPGVFYPFQISGYLKVKNEETGETQPYISVAYGEVNQVAPDGLQEGKYQEFAVDEKGVVYLAVMLDADQNVTECWISLAQTDESVPADTDTEIHFLLGRFYLDETADNIPVPTQLLGENVNVNPFLTVDLNTFDLVRQYPHVYTRPRATSDNLFDLLYNKLLEALQTALQAMINAAQTAINAAVAAAQAAATAASNALSSAESWAEFAQSKAQEADYALTAAQAAATDASNAAADAWNAETDAWNAANSASSDADAAATNASISQVAAASAQASAAAAGVSASQAVVSETNASLSASSAAGYLAAIQALSWMATCNNDGTITISAT